MYLLVSLASLAGALYLIYSMINDNSEELADAEGAVAELSSPSALDRARDTLRGLGRKVHSRGLFLLLKAHETGRRWQFRDPFKAVAGWWPGGTHPKETVLPPD